MYKNTVTHYVTKSLVDILFYVGIAAVITVPFWSKFIRDIEGYTQSQWYIIMIMLILSGLCVVYIILNLKRMFKTLIGKNPFVEQNVQALRKIAISCIVIALIYAIKCIIMFTLATLIVVAIFVTGTLFCLTLKDIFKQAVYYKEENDWTV